jgi:hypothetical protein
MYVMHVCYAFMYVCNVYMYVMYVMYICMLCMYVMYVMYVCNVSMYGVSQDLSGFYAAIYKIYCALP